MNVRNTTHFFTPSDVKSCTLNATYNYRNYTGRKFCIIKGDYLHGIVSVIFLLKFLDILDHDVDKFFTPLFFLVKPAGLNLLSGLLSLLLFSFFLAGPLSLPGLLSQGL